MPIISMETKLIVSLLMVLISTLAIFTSSLIMVWADSDKDYCYDQVGDGHFCLNSKQKCEHEQKDDEIAESPCYNEDNNV